MGTVCQKRLLLRTPGPVLFGMLYSVGTSFFCFCNDSGFYIPNISCYFYFAEHLRMFIPKITDQYNLTVSELLCALYFVFQEKEMFVSTKFADRHVKG